MSERSPSQALAGRARGVLVGALIAFGWAGYGASTMPAPVRIVVLAAAAAATVALIIASVAMQRGARALPQATPAQASASRRAWRWFWLNLLGEIVLLNVALRLLDAPDRHIYWIPAISAVVGLHFWPMALFFRVRSYWAVGLAMILGAAIAAALLASERASAAVVVPAEALTNAVILCAALAAGAIAALRQAPAPR